MQNDYQANGRRYYCTGRKVKSFTEDGDTMVIQRRFEADPDIFRFNDADAYDGGEACYELQPLPTIPNWNQPTPAPQYLHQELDYELQEGDHVLYRNADGDVLVATVGKGWEAEIGEDGVKYPSLGRGIEAYFEGAYIPGTPGTENFNPDPYSTWKEAYLLGKKQ